MEILEWITAIALVLGIGGAGVTKLTRQAMPVAEAERLGYTNLMMPIGAAEVLGAIGVIIGAASGDLEWLGVLAGLGIVAMMVGAFWYHQRAGDGNQRIPSVVLAVVAILYIVALFAN
jgi:hypothetical protein